MEIRLCEQFDYRIKDKNKDIYSMFNTSVENVLRNNKDLSLYEGEWVKIKVNDYVTHIVKPAETIDIIAKNYGTKTEQIIEENQLMSDKLFIGQILKIKQ